jgi:hypothetical protein
MRILKNKIERKVKKKNEIEKRKRSFVIRVKNECGRQWWRSKLLPIPCKNYWFITIDVELKALDIVIS